MKARKTYYYYLDIIRTFCCFAILLYHMNILKGGYLAVCSFFVLSGFLSFKTAYQEKNFDFKSYYKKKFLKLYLPLLIVILLTIPIVSLLPDVGWFQMKPEATSNILGYNNFWQLSANLDYFARHINSPFMHLWYISILLQFDLIFPFLYKALEKVKEKFHKITPCIFTTVLACASAIAFYVICTKGNVMVAYYHTLTRIFSLLFGVSLGMVHCYDKPKILKQLKKKPKNKYVFYTYLILLTLLFCFIDAKSVLFPAAMIITTLLTCRLIDYATIIKKSKKEITRKNKCIQFLSHISYEIYLIQYPIIFLLQYVDWNIYFEYLFLLCILLGTACLLHFILKQDGHWKVIKIILRILLLGVLLIGGYQYIIAKDYTSEMKELEEQLQQNEKIIEDKQKEYEQTFQEQENEFQNLLKNLENNEEKLDEVIANIQIVGVGDSVMLGAVPNLYKQFPNGYFDAKISRTAWVANDILQELKSKNMLAGNIILNLGTNGDCPEDCKTNIMNTVENREVFWVNVTNDDSVHVNDALLSFSKKYKNLHIIDWASISKNHAEYFVADKIHLTEEGKKAYTKAIYHSVYQLYYDKYQKQKEELIGKHDQELKKKVTFFGNDILLNAFSNIDKVFPKDQFIMKKDYPYDTLKEKINNALKNKSLSYNIVFAFDETSKFTLEQYQELINLCKDHKIYIVSSSEETNEILYSLSKHVTIIHFDKEIKSHPEYLMADKIHLSEEGNKALSILLEKSIKK